MLVTDADADFCQELKNENEDRRAGKRFCLWCLIFEIIMTFNIGAFELGFNEWPSGLQRQLIFSFFEEVSKAVFICSNRIEECGFLPL